MGIEHERAPSGWFRKRRRPTGHKARQGGGDSEGFARTEMREQKRRSSSASYLTSFIIIYVKCRDY